MTNRRRRGVFATLVRHFLRQLVSFETLATGGELKHVVIAVLSLLAGPGYLFAIAAYIGLTRRLVASRGQVPPLLLLWREEWLVFTISLCSVAVLTALQWRGFVLGGRDFRILGVLPLRRSTVLAAKLTSVAIAVLVLHVAVNSLACAALPLSSPVGVGRMAAAMQLALFAQTVFACFAVVALHGLVALLTPPAVARRLAVALQFAILLAAALLFVAQRELGRLALEMADVAHTVNRLLPLAWFMGLYKHMLGAESPQLASQVRLALGATALVVLVAVPCCLLGYRDGDTRPFPKLLAARVRRPRPRTRLGPRAPVARAVCLFVTRAVLRHETASLVLGGWFALGVAVALAGFGGALLRGGVLLGPPTPATLSPAIVLCFFALVGLRLSACYPVQLEANWLFRLAEVPGHAGYAAGVRAAAIRIGVAPPLLALFGPAAWAWGPGTALLHTAFASALALLTVEWLFLGFGKVPFTCSYQPGKANLRATWPAYFAIGIVYCGILPEIEAWALGRPPAILALAALLVGARAWLVRRAALRAAKPLVFDDQPPALVTGLGL